MAKVTKESNDNWRIESDFRTLKEAEMIKCDKERLNKALKFGKGELKAIKSLEDLRAYKEEKDKNGYDDSDDDDDRD